MDSKAQPISLKKVRKNIKKAHYFDYGLLMMVFVIFGFGLIMVYSTSAYRASVSFDDPSYYLKRQSAAGVLGMILMFAAYRIDYHKLCKYAGTIYLLALAACVYVMFFGTAKNNSQRWIQVGPITVQPSELAKVAVIIFMAALITRSSRKLNSWQNIIKEIVFVIPMFIAVAVSNLSTAVIIFGIVLIMLFVSTRQHLFMILVTLGGALLAAVFVVGYRANRVQAWLHPETVSDSSVYQTLQALYAIGSGGLFGKGLGESIQKLGNLPVAMNDMIFAVICEELGIFGAVCVIIMYLLLLWRLMYIANHARDIQGSYIVIGIMAHIALQAVLNIAVVTNVIPNTGVTLPLISYGGTSVVITLAEMGIALSVSRQIPMDRGQL